MFGTSSSNPFLYPAQKNIHEIGFRKQSKREKKTFFCNLVPWVRNPGIHILAHYPPMSPAGWMMVLDCFFLFELSANGKTYFLLSSLSLCLHSCMTDMIDRSRHGKLNSAIAISCLAVVAPAAAAASYDSNQTKVKWENLSAKLRGQTEESLAQINLAP